MTHAGVGAGLIHTVAVITVHAEAVVIVNLTRDAGESRHTVAGKSINLKQYDAVTTNESARERNYDIV